MVVSILAEVAWIGGAAMAGTASHFNDATPALSALYKLMGAFAVILTSAGLVYGIAIWRIRETGLPRALHLAIALGLVLTFVLTVPVAGTMAQMPGHHVGVPVTGMRIPVFGCPARPATCAPRTSWPPTRCTSCRSPVCSPSRRCRSGRRCAAIWAAALVFVAAVAAAFLGALAGPPLIPLA